MRRQEMAGLTCGGYEHRTVRVGEIIDPAIACAMDVFKRFWPAAAYTAAHQRIVAAACGLADIHKILKQEIVAQGRMVMRGLMCITPAQSFQRPSPGFGNPDKRVVQRQLGHLSTGFDSAALFDVTPDFCTVQITKYTFNKQRFHVSEACFQRAQLVLNKAGLQRFYPGRI